MLHNVFSVKLWYSQTENHDDSLARRKQGRVYQSVLAGENVGWAVRKNDK